MEIQGKILEISDSQQITQTFKKREFVVEYAENPQYPEFIKFELIQDKCSLMDGFKAGDAVNVSFNLKGRKWDDPKGGVKYFNSLQAWRVQSASDGANATAASAAPETSGMDQMEEPGWINGGGDSGDDLPF